MKQISFDTKSSPSTLTFKGLTAKELSFVQNWVKDYSKNCGAVRIESKNNSIVLSASFSRLADFISEYNTHPTEVI